MGGEIIRQGDPTSHGGRVLEGSTTDICHGKPIAYKGHKTYCPLCKGIFPIVEGVSTMTFYGNGIAVAGMRTACGATLVATQFTDVVEDGGGSNTGSNTRAFHTSTRSNVDEPPAAPDTDDGQTEQEVFYSLVGEDDQPLDGFLYDLYANGTLHTQATEYDNGCTMTLKNCSDSQLVSWLARDSGAKS